MSAADDDPASRLTGKRRLARAIPGVVGVLDGGAANGVPWVRTKSELDEEWFALKRAAGTMVVDGFVDYENMRGSEKALLGMWGAARWTLDLVAMTPITRDDQDVTGVMVAREYHLAEEIIRTKGEGWEYCAGSAVWLEWVTDLRQVLIWPGWAATHPAKAIYHQPGPPPPFHPRRPR